MKKRSITVAVAVGLGVSLLVALLGCVAAAFLIGGGVVEDVGLGTLLILLLAAVAGSLTAAAVFRGKLLLVCGLVGAALFGVLLIGRLLFCEGPLQNLPATLAVIFGGSMAVALLALRSGGGMNKPRKRYRFR